MAARLYGTRLGAPCARLCVPRVAMRGLGTMSQRPGLTVVSALSCPKRPLSQDAGDNFSSRVQRRVDEASAFVQEHKYALGIVGFSAVCLWGLQKLTWNVTSFLLSINHEDVFKVGAVTGALAAGIVVAGGMALRQSLVTTPQGLRQAAVEQLRGDRRVSAKLGDKLSETEPWSAIAFENLRDALLGSETRARSTYWQLPARRCQMLFPIDGQAAKGVVFVQGYKRGGSYRVEAMSLTLTRTGETVWLVGNSSSAFSPLHQALAVKLEDGSAA